MTKYNCALLVDDDENACFLNSITLEGSEFASYTHISTDGDEALNFIRNQCETGKRELCPDIIFLDIGMPLLDGFGFLDKLNEIDFKTKKPKVFILTSSNHKEDIEKAQDYDVDAYIVKPLTKPKLTEIMNAF